MTSLQCITYQKRDNVAEVVHHQHKLRMSFQKILGTLRSFNVTVDEKEMINKKWLLVHYKVRHGT